ncbi:hypothetical protein AA650_03185 [Anabaena sp. WA102]|nr:hypothetical protein AA650_03185 [Anabaena sp. WA102]OBQ16823.1 MAG: hypothetical protein AN486_17500 [Anabaena sp. AL93]
MARQKAKGKRQEARVKRVWAILHFFTQFGFIVFTYLHRLVLLCSPTYIRSQKEAVGIIKTK